MSDIRAEAQRKAVLKRCRTDLLTAATLAGKALTRLAQHIPLESFDNIVHVNKGRNAVNRIRYIADNIEVDKP